MVERAGMITNRITEYRARFDLKQEELARRVGVRRETIGNLEKGRYNPSLVDVYKRQHHNLIKFLRIRF